MLSFEDFVAAWLRACQILGNGLFRVSCKWTQRPETQPRSDNTSTVRTRNYEKAEARQKNIKITLGSGYYNAENQKCNFMKKYNDFARSRPFLLILPI